MQRIADLLDLAGSGDAWHGPPVDATLSGISLEQAAARPLPNGHSIWEIALHIAVWDRVVARRFRGEVFEPSPAEDWPSPAITVDETEYTVIGVIPREARPRGRSGREKPSPAAEAAWNRAVADVRTARGELREAMLAFDPARLFDTVRGKSYTYYVMAHGIVQHDLYHAGQIALLRKAAS
jgi:uncharacterized damage-inducible protein DinB